MTEEKTPDAHIRARPMRMQRTEQMYVTWYHTVPAHVPFEAVLRPDFWTNVAKNQLRPHHRVVVDSEDGTWTATLFVRSVATLSAVVSVLEKHDLDAEGEHPVLKPLADEYEIAFAGPAHMWRVVRKADKEVLRHGFQSKEAAGQWLGNHLRGAAEAA